MTMPIDNKSLCSVFIVLIIMVSLCSVIIVHETTGESKTDTQGEYNILARVNTEGSGIYIKDTVLSAKGGVSAFYNTSTFEITEADNKAAWGGLVVGTPGAATIQHVQMQQIAEKAGLIFTLYQDGMSTDGDHMYYVATMSNAATVTGYTGQLDAGILWEPQYSKIINTDGFSQLVLTNDLFPNHTCCNIVGVKDYISSHKDVTERVLAAYVKAAKYVDYAVNHVGSDEYNELVDICQDVVGAAIDVSTIKDALSTITYVYADDDKGTLNGLKSDVADLADSLIDMGLLRHNLADLGFNYSSQFANAFVDEGYLTNAVKRLDADDPTLAGANAIVTIAVIAGDIHQIAIHVANALGYFTDNHITVNISAATNGPGVAVAVQNGTAQFGVLGAPPATSTAINGMLVQA